jgi:hypothetical protein
MDIEPSISKVTAVKYLNFQSGQLVDVKTDTNVQVLITVAVFPPPALAWSGLGWTFSFFFNFVRFCRTTTPKMRAMFAKATRRTNAFSATFFAQVSQNVTITACCSPLA